MCKDNLSGHMCTHVYTCWRVKTAALLHVCLYVMVVSCSLSLHSHLLCKQGKTKAAVSAYSVSPTVNEEALQKATLTLRERNVASFDVVESLVEEEVSVMNYACTGGVC